MVHVSISVVPVGEEYMFRIEICSSLVCKDAYNVVKYLRGVQMSSGLAEDDIHFGNSLPQEYRTQLLKDLGFSK